MERICHLPAKSASLTGAGPADGGGAAAAAALSAAALSFFAHATTRVSATAMMTRDSFIGVPPAVWDVGEAKTFTNTGRTVKEACGHIRSRLGEEVPSRRRARIR